MDFMSDNLYNGRHFRVLNVCWIATAGIISVSKSIHQSMVKDMQRSRANRMAERLAGNDYGR